MHPLHLLSANAMGRKGHPLGQSFFLFMLFLGKIYQTLGRRLLLGFTPPSAALENPGPITEFVCQMTLAFLLHMKSH